MVATLAANASTSVADTVRAIPIEPIVSYAVQWLRLAVEIVGAVIITVGVLSALWSFARVLARRETPNFNRIRISFARYLALALEFQLGADILSTAIAPSWDQIGKLGAIAVIRTALNYFLIREMREEEGRPEERDRIERPVSG